MKLLEGLNQTEKKLLLNFPVYISLLAANADGELDKTEQKEAKQLTHIKTYSSDPSLLEYYKEVEKNFDENIIKLDKELPTKKEEREESIKKELAKVEGILDKIDKEIATKLHESMKMYTENIINAHHSSLELFLIPFFISGLTDENAK